MGLVEVVVVDFIVSSKFCVNPLVHYINLAYTNLKTGNNSYLSTAEIFLHKNMLKQPCKVNLLAILSPRILPNTDY
jgi:hypothetical protein